MANTTEKKDAKINVDLSTSDLKTIIEVLDFAIEEIELGSKQIEEMKEMAKDNELLLLDNEKWRNLNSKYGKHIQNVESIETLHHYLSYSLKLHDIPSNADEEA